MKLFGRRSLKPAEDPCQVPPSPIAIPQGPAVQDPAAVPEEDKTCSICLEAFDRYTVDLACVSKHTFHAQCIAEWLYDEHKEDCPNCRRPIVGKERHDLLDVVSAIEIQKIKDLNPICCNPWFRKR